MTTVPSLPATLKLGPVHLNVTDLDRSVAYYERALGLTLLGRGADVARLGDSSNEVLALHAVPGGRVPGEHDAEMFHYCLLYPSREELARASRRLTETGTPITHQNDRHTHEAIYLDDPDGIHIELAWDRPRDRWPETPYGRPPVELDVEGLLATIEGEPSSPAVGDGLGVGHIHFTTGSVEDAIAFYRDTLGFDLRYQVATSEKYKAGAFFSVGGYHHHTASNVAKGAGVGPLPEGSIGIRHWTIVLPGADEVAAVARALEAAGRLAGTVDGGLAVNDPWDIPVHVVS
jgi:catechol 2,3-dioxygenase